MSEEISLSYNARLAAEGLTEDPDIQLKRCPFCDSQATFLFNRISCDACLCDLNRGSNQTAQQLIDCWNTRPDVRDTSSYQLNQEATGEERQAFHQLLNTPYGL